MKKTYLIIFLVSSIISATSQTKPLSLLLKTGINISHYDLPKQYSPNDRIIDKGSIENFQIAVLTDLSLEKHLIIETGLIFNGKGGKTEISKPVVLWENSTSKPIYLEVPVNLIYSQDLVRNFKIFVGGGPYVSLGIGGKNKYSGNDGDIISHPYSGNKIITYGKDNQNYEGTYNRLTPIDFGLNTTAGIQYKKLQLYFNYGFGMQDVKPKDSHENMGKNRTLTFGVGYFLHK
ncbi:MAG TPA: porin family protein [Chitinophagaceae bacterium]